MNSAATFLLTIGTACRRTSLKLQAAGSTTPDLDARLIVGLAVGMDAVGVIANARQPLTGEAESRLEAYTARRLAGEPVARILGRREFWGLEFLLDRDTLVPRPDSETIVDAVLSVVGTDRDREFRIADLGTGSGCLLVALLSELPAARGIGVDLSIPALAIARRNADLNGVASRATFAAGSWSETLAPGLDVIVANPPYIPSLEIGGLAAEAQRDPILALDGGPDGLDAYRAIIPQARRKLAPRGLLAVEFGIGQAASVAALAREADLKVLDVRRDLAGIERVLMAMQPA